MTNILITGGCGFLGRHLVPEVRRAFPAARIVALDLADRDDLAAARDDVTVLTGRDVRDPAGIIDDFRGIDTVIHCAGLVSFRVRAKEELQAVNVEGTKNVLAAAAHHGVDRFVHVSSVAALGYKDSEDDLVDEDFVFRWEEAEKKRKYYSLSKRHADLAVERYRGGMDVLTVYPGLMLGPGDGNNSARLIAGIETGQIPINTPGGTNVIDVRDVARGIAMLLEAGSTGRFLLSGHNVRLQELNRVIADVVGVTPPTTTLPSYLGPITYYLALGMELVNGNSPVTADNLHSSFRFRYFDNSKARREIGWSPEIPLRRTIEDTYRWMTGHAVA